MSSLCFDVCSTGEFTVGKITYSSQEILGHGSEGTVVFKYVIIQEVVSPYTLVGSRINLGHSQLIPTSYFRHYHHGNKWAECLVWLSHGMTAKVDRWTVTLMKSKARIVVLV